MREVRARYGEPAVSPALTGIDEFDSLKSPLLERSAWYFLPLKCFINPLKLVELSGRNSGACFGVIQQPCEDK